VTKRILSFLQEMQKKYRSIIDNITAENIVPMAKKMISLPIKTDGCLKNVVELLFQKVYKKKKKIELNYDTH
jgi:hypothetical protein